MRVDALDHLAVEFEHEAKHAVRRRMLRAEVDSEIAGGHVIHESAIFLRLLLSLFATRYSPFPMRRWPSAIRRPSRLSPRPAP